MSECLNVAIVVVSDGSGRRSRGLRRDGTMGLYQAMNACVWLLDGVRAFIGRDPEQTKPSDTLRDGLGEGSFSS